MPFISWGQTSYSALWKKAQNAYEKDLPQSQYEILQQIVQKATREKLYGQLLKAELNACQVMQTIAPDSIKPAVERIQQRCDATTDPVLKTVYQTVLWRVWLENPRLSEEDEEGVKPQQPDKPVLTPERCERLAQVKDESYEPFVVEGSDSKIFGNDLLSIVGMELGDYHAPHDYYAKTGNRQAACMMALKAVYNDYVSQGDDILRAKLDSLLEVYGDLPIAGEIAIERFATMDRRYGAFTAEEKINYIHHALDKWSQWPRIKSLKNNEAELIRSQFYLGNNTSGRPLITPMTAQQIPVRELLCHAPFRIAATAQPMDSFVGVFCEEAESDRRCCLSMIAVYCSVYQRCACHQALVFGIRHKSVYYHINVFVIKEPPCLVDFTSAIT